MRGHRVCGLRLGLALALLAVLLGLNHAAPAATQGLGVAAADLACPGGAVPDPSDHATIAHAPCRVSVACQIFTNVAPRPAISRARPSSPALLVNRVAGGRHVPPELRPPNRLSRA